MGQFSKKFEDLQFSDNYIFCKDDPFKHEIPLYTEHKVFKELPLVEIDDKTHKLFYNCSAYAKAADEEVSSVLEFIYNLKAKSKFTKKLQDSVLLAKAEPVFKDEYMYFADILEDEVKKAHELAARKKADEDAIALLKLHKLSLEDIATAIGIPLEHVKELAEQLEQQKMHA